VDALIQIVIGGLLQGSLFAVVALGFSLVFRMTGVVNLSQGAFCVLGALLAYSLETAFHLPVPLAVLLAVLAAVLYGLAIGAAAFVPALARLPNSSMLMLTAGLLTFTQGLMLATPTRWRRFPARPQCCSGACAFRPRDFGSPEVRP
jgi:branched-chain amino acid transport system permease protein